MKKTRNILLFVALIMVCGACEKKPDNTLITNKLAIIPEPVKVKLEPGSFTIEKGTVVFCNSKELLPVAKYLDEKLSGALGFNLRIQEGSGKGINLGIADVEREGG